MITRPRIFVSAVSRELKSARQLVANILTALGFEPVWQDIFGTEQGDLREMLRRQIDTCEGVYQLVGQCSGFTPPAPDEDFGSVSYTQYEALYAKSKGIKVWYVLLDPAFTTDPHEPESAEQRTLQQSYRKNLQNSEQLFHPILSSDALEANVFKLRDDLSRLRRRSRQWTVLLMSLLLVISLGVVWLVLGHSKTSREMDQLKHQNEAFMQALRDLPETLSQTSKATQDEDESTRLARAYAALETKLNLPQGTLEKELPKFAEQLLTRPDTSVMDRANALFATKKFAEAEAAALEAKDRALAAAGKPVADAISALELAGHAARSQIRYGPALDHYRAAAALTSRERNPLEWARVQWSIAFMHMIQGTHQEGERTYREIWKVYNEHLGPDDLNTMYNRANTAWSLSCLGRNAEAEVELRAVIPFFERALGAEHSDTLWCRHRLGYALKGLDRNAEAEAEHRAVLAIRQRVLGPDHPDTLWSRGTVADVLWQRGEHAEAEKEYQAILLVRQRELGDEHLDTLLSRNAVAIALHDRGKLAEAEAEHRAVLGIRERLLGPYHPDTLWSRGNLADVLRAQGRRAEAEQELRTVLTARQRLLGPEHPDTLQCRSMIAFVLKEAGKFAEARKEYEDILAIRSRLLGPEHSSTLQTRFCLAGLLLEEGKPLEAEKAHRDVLAARLRILGPDHMETLGSRQDLALLLSMMLRGKDAEAEHVIVLAALERTLGKEHPESLKCRMAMYTAIGLQGRIVDAEKSMQELLAVQIRVLGPDHTDVALSHGLLGSFLGVMGKYAEALEHIRAAEERLTRAWGPDHRRVIPLKRGRQQMEAALKQSTPAAQPAIPQ